MFTLSQTTGYAIRALACLHECGDGLMLAKDVARCTGIPLPYLQKILRDLGRSGLIEAHRGMGGGFALRKPPEKISFYDIARFVDGNDVVPACLLGIGEDSPCQTSTRCHRLWAAERRRLIRLLKSLTLVDARSRGSRACGSGSGGKSSATVESSQPRVIASRPRQRSRS
jgi:Rrf2 family protein